VTLEDLYDLSFHFNEEQKYLPREYKKRYNETVLNVIINRFTSLKNNQKKYEGSLNKEDIIKTKEKIIQLINELDLNLKDKFMDAFNRINDNFRTIFCEVFRGGNASMILTKPDNIFETGIEIVIQPPGKNISNISLLSGGETAMSSISLLFAFFLYLPSPFCIMDEVDAPFDENNIMLFKRLIQRFSKDTQFFLISHNKLTLEIADILYGITMENDGISKVVSVKLEEIKTTNS
ncbi:MAG: DUF2115 family protein, partial [Spirochaetota bacterium]